MDEDFLAKVHSRCRGRGLGVRFSSAWILSIPNIQLGLNNPHQHHLYKPWHLQTIQTSKPSRPPQTAWRTFVSSL